jgi:hypothetical protein
MILSWLNGNEAELFARQRQRQTAVIEVSPESGSANRYETLESPLVFIARLQFKCSAPSNSN